MEPKQIHYEPGDRVALLEGGPPMIVTGSKDNGRTVTAKPISEEQGGEQDFDATKLTKLDSQQSDQKL